MFTMPTDVALRSVMGEVIVKKGTRGIVRLEPTP